jgi:hypothetical protein
MMTGQGQFAVGMGDMQMQQQAMQQHAMQHQAMMGMQHQQQAFPGARLPQHLV